MFEEEVKKLSAFDVYVMSVYNLKDLYFFANGAYSEALSEIEFKKTPMSDYYIKKLIQYRNKLESDYGTVRMLKSKVVKRNLNQYQKMALSSNDELFEKVKKLLANMNNFLSQHDIDLSI